MKHIGRLGWMRDFDGNVFYDAAGNEWRRFVGAVWWMLVRKET